MRPAILLFTALSAGALAHSTSPRTTSGSHAASTMNLFLGPSATPYGLVGSVVHTDKCGTTYALHCTSYHSPEARHTTIFGLCDPSYTVTATYGPSSYALYGVNSIFGGTGGVVTNVQTCSLDSTTEAICSVTKTIGTTKDAILTSQVVTLTGTNLLFGQIPITAGGEKLSNLAACTPTSSGGAAVATGISQAYKVIVVPGAAALLAGALL